MMIKPKPALKPIVEFLTTCRKKTVTLKITCYKTGIDSKAALRVMRKLTKEGHLKLVEEGKLFNNKKGGVHSKNPTWKIADRKALPLALERKNKTGPVRDRMWKAMRIKRIFLLKDITKLADVKEATVMNYIKILERNKYARKVGKRSQRQGQNWQLIRNDGPKRPALKEYPEANNG